MTRTKADDRVRDGPRRGPAGAGRRRRARRSARTTRSRSPRGWCCGTGAGPVVDEPLHEPDRGRRGAPSAGARSIRAPVGEVNVAVRMRERTRRDRRGGERRGDPARAPPGARRARRRGLCSCNCWSRRDGRCRRSWRASRSYVIVKDKLRSPGRAARCGVRGAAGGFPGRGGGHAGRAPAVVARPLGARAAVGDRADRAGHRRGADEARGAGAGRARSRAPLDALVALTQSATSLIQDRHMCGIVGYVGTAGCVTRSSSTG